MILWFAGAALVAMWMTFRDPAIDHRVVVVGALLPDLLDAPTRGIWFFHTLVAPLVVLAAVMLATVGRRLLRRRLLALPIGMLLHLVFDPVWHMTEVFWWPVRGFGFDGPIPAFDRPVAALIVLEALGLLALWWVARRFGLDDVRRREAFVKTGRIDRALTDPDHQPPTC